MGWWKLRSYQGPKHGQLSWALQTLTAAPRCKFIAKCLRPPPQSHSRPHCAPLADPVASPSQNSANGVAQHCGPLCRATAAQHGGPLCRTLPRDAAHAIAGPHCRTSRRTSNAQRCRTAVARRAPLQDLHRAASRDPWLQRRGAAHVVAGPVTHPSRGPRRAAPPAPPAGSPMRSALAEAPPAAPPASRPPAAAGGGGPRSAPRPARSRVHFIPPLIPRILRIAGAAQPGREPGPPRRRPGSNSASEGSVRRPAATYRRGINSRAADQKKKNRRGAADGRGGPGGGGRSSPAVRGGKRGRGGAARCGGPAPRRCRAGAREGGKKGGREAGGGPPRAGAEVASRRVRAAAGPRPELQQAAAART